MANEVAARPGVADFLAKQYDMEPGDFWMVLKRTIMPEDATNEEIAGVLMVMREYGLNPFLKQIHAFKSKKSGRIMAVVGIDGWTAIVNRQVDYDGCELTVEFDGDGKPFSATCTMHHKQRRFPVIVTEYFAECWRDTDAWKLTPSRMIRHRAFMQAARLCFGITGGLDEDNPEIEPIDITARSSEIKEEAKAAPAAPKAPPARKSRAKEAPKIDADPAGQVIDGQSERVEEKVEEKAEDKPARDPVNLQQAFREFIDHLGDAQTEDDVNALIEESDIRAVLTADEDALDLVETAIKRKLRAFA